MSPFDPEGPKPSQRERVEHYDEEEKEEDSSLEGSTIIPALEREREVE